MVVAIAASLPSQTRADLLRMLEQSVAVPSPATVRQARVGLLVELLVSGSGEVPGMADYDAFRTARLASAPDEEWPAASTLLRYWGSWPSCVGVASKVAFESTARRPARDHHHARPDNAGGTPGQPARGGYTRMDTVDALRGARRLVGDWPTTTEYTEFAQLQRALCRARGLEPARIPSMKQIRQQYGTFDTAVADAQRAEEAAARTRTRSGERGRPRGGAHG